MKRVPACSLHATFKRGYLKIVARIIYRILSMCIYMQERRIEWVWVHCIVRRLQRPPIGDDSMADSNLLIYLFSALKLKSHPRLYSTWIVLVSLCSVTPLESGVQLRHLVGLIGSNKLPSMGKYVYASGQSWQTAFSITSWLNETFNLHGVLFDLQVEHSFGCKRKNFNMQDLSNLLAK